jgi:HD-like signal output (HDOD) protein
VVINRECMPTLLHVFQAEVGAMLVDHWQLPATVGQTILGVVGEEVEPGGQKVVDIVKAAKVFAATTLAGTPFEYESLSTDTAIIAINLFAEDIASLLERAETIGETPGALLS